MTVTLGWEFINLFCSGVLAGALIVIDYGIRVPLSSLDPISQLKMRKALIYRLRVLIPMIFVPTVATGVLVIILDSSSAGHIYRTAGTLLMVSCFLTSIYGTAPINKAILKWNNEAPPEDWESQVIRWSRFDTLRTWMGIASFVVMLMAIAIRFMSP